MGPRTRLPFLLFFAIRRSMSQYCDDCLHKYHRCICYKPCPDHEMLRPIVPDPEQRIGALPSTTLPLKTTPSSLSLLHSFNTASMEEKSAMTARPIFRDISNLGTSSGSTKSKSYFPGLTLKYKELAAIRRQRSTVRRKTPPRTKKGVFTPSANDARGSSTANKREAYLSIRRGLPLQEIIDDHPEELSFIHSAARYAPPCEEAAKVLYLFGKTGSGKTTSTLKVLQELELSFFKKMPGTHWFDGYTGQQVLVLEEFQSCFTLTKFLSMCDPHPPQLEIKGGTMPNRSPYIIICSNKSPLRQYTTVQEESPTSFAAFLRRINTEVDCTGREYGDIEAHIRSFLTPDTL